MYPRPWANVSIAACWKTNAQHLMRAVGYSDGSCEALTRVMPGWLAGWYRPTWSAGCGCVVDCDIV